VGKDARFTGRQGLLADEGGPDVSPWNLQRPRPAKWLHRVSLVGDVGKNFLTSCPTAEPDESDVIDDEIRRVLV
jgi:hypothetical protein